MDEQKCGAVGTHSDDAGVLENVLTSSRAETVRWAAFLRLLEIHGQELVVRARRQAVTLGLGATSAGDEAISEVFIKLTSRLACPWPNDRSFLDRFTVEIWNELRHQRTREARLRDRFSPIADEEHPATDENPEYRYQSKEQLQRIWQRISRLCRTRKQKRLVQAWTLSKLGYEWMEVKDETGWPGTSDSLRTSVSRFIGQLRSRIVKQTS